MTLFTPALLFSKVAYFLSPGLPSSIYLSTRARLTTIRRKAQGVMDNPHLVHPRDHGLDVGWTYTRRSIPPSTFAEVRIGFIGKNSNREPYFVV